MEQIVAFSVVTDPPVLAADERWADFCLRVDEPLNVASSRSVSAAEAALAVAQGLRFVPLLYVLRVSAVASPRLCA